MATEQVLQWMQQEVKLSKLINSFEADFANGFHFGEILCQFGILDDISRFSKKTNKEAKVANFYKIEGALRAMKIRFDAKLINNIMNEERGAALRLLYQIKRAIQLQNGPPPDALDGFTQTGLKKSLLDKVREQRFEQTNALASTIEYKTQGGKDVRSNKLKSQDRHLVSFDIHQKLLFEKAKNDADRDDELVAKYWQEDRQKSIKKLQENQQFMKQWEQEGIQNWKKNRSVREENIAKVKYFEDREVNLFKAKLEKELNSATVEMRSGLSEFEKNLQKLGIEQNVNMDDAIKRMAEKAGIPPGQIQNFSYAATMNKIKETKKQSDFAGKERERRRTKLVVDQATTQAHLDKQREEDLLIQKLLLQQATESKEAFIEHRFFKCKQMQLESRKQKADENEVKKQQKMAKIDEQRIAETKAAEPKRKADIQKQRLAYEKVTKDKKTAKRKVNIEIASEIVDLIMDMTNEAHDLMKGRENKKLNKEDWREFMNIFKDGKRVSLRNVVKKHVESANADQNEISFNKGITANEIMVMYQNIPALPEFYQFLCGTGQFDLAEIKPKLWDFVQASNSLSMPSGCKSVLPNISFSQLLEDVLDRQQRKVVRKDEPKADLRVPADLVLKLAVLGRAFSGKKTVAKQIQEHYGGAANIKIFNMDEIIVEALEYVTPKKVEESQTQAKQPPKKGQKVDEVVPVDIFEGKTVDEYKRLANQIKSQYFPDFYGEFASKIDLSNQVLDDEPLVKLFVERLKLEFEGKLKKPDLRQGCIREREILQQLKDIEQTEQSVDVTKDKGKKPAAGKGGPVKGPDEILKEELETIRRMDVNGWVLVGFPKTLAQTKLLEKALSGFEMKVDQPRTKKSSFQDAWAKVAFPSCLDADKDELEVMPSSLDGVLFMQVGDEEVMRRSKNRKIDPQTNIIYHMEDNPPEPEGKDVKMLDRLQEYKDEAGNANRITSINQRYNHAVNLIYKFTEQFGLIDPKTQECKVPLNMRIKQANWEHWRQKDAVKEAVFEQIKRIIDFKQEQFSAQRQRILEVLEEDASRQRTSQDSKVIQPGSEMPGSRQESIENREANFSQPVPYASTSMLLMQQREELRDKQSTLSHRDGMSYGGASATIDGLRSSKLLRRIYEINDAEKAFKWEQMVNTYYQEGVQCFNMMRLLRERVFMSLNKTQNSFINFLERQGVLQKKINDFCENYNKFNDEFPQLRDNAKTQEELINRVDILSQQLWEGIQARNQEAVKERTKYMEGGWVYVEMTNLVTYIARLIENEWLRFTMVAALVTGFVLNEDLDLQTLVKRLSERGVEPYQSAPDGSPESPILKEAISSLLNALSTMFNEQYFVNLEHKQLEMISRERDNLYVRINMLLVWSGLALQEISIHSSKVFDVLDDWIVVSVKTENDLCQRAVREIRDLVFEKKSYIDTVLLGDFDLASQIDTLTFEEGPLLYMEEYKPKFQLADLRIELATLNYIYDVFKSNSVGQGLLDTQTFLTLMVIFLQRGDLPAQWRSVQFEKIVELAQQFTARPESDSNAGQTLFRGKSVILNDKERTFVNWKRIFVAIALNANPFPQTKDLKAYLLKLESLVDPTTGLVSEEQFIKVPAFFDAIEGLILTKSNDTKLSFETEEEEEIDRERIAAIKRLLYKTFKVTNQAGLRVADLQATLEALFRYSNDKRLFDELFN